MGKAMHSREQSYNLKLKENHSNHNPDQVKFPFSENLSKEDLNNNQGPQVPLPTWLSVTPDDVPELFQCFASDSYLDTFVI